MRMTEKQHKNTGIRPLGPPTNECNGGVSSYASLHPQNGYTLMTSDVSDADVSSEENEGEAIRQLRREVESGEEARTGAHTSYSPSEAAIPAKKAKAFEKDLKRLSRDRWIEREGHRFTYLGIFLFTLTLYFRPYELVPALSVLDSLAFFLALATLLIYLPTQFALEGSITTLSTEIKCILFLALLAIITIPIATSPGIAWKMFSDVFIKIVIVFVIMINTLRSRSRLTGLMLLAIGAAVMLSFQAIVLYQDGEFKTEGYRVNVDFGGMFGNPNDMATHLVIFMPVAVALGFASKSKVAKLAYFSAAGLMIVGNMVTQSRGGFLGLIAVSSILVWKLAKKQRLKAIVVASLFAFIIMAFAPGNYGLRVVSIFVPSLDPVGSSDQRKILLEQSIIVSLRNPQGIGMGNFPLVGSRNLQTHNSYTQVSSELGILALAAYLIIMVSPLRKLGAIERQLARSENYDWIYYAAVGVQASIIGYMVASFFGSIAYQWYVYYPIAFAVCLRRIYHAEHPLIHITQGKERGIRFDLQLQKV